MHTQTKETQKQLTPSKSLAILKEGNKRFVQNLKADRDLLKQVNETAGGQFPFAVILSCIDSRTCAELIFDQGLGDIVSIRVAGNVLNDDITASMELACNMAGAKLIVVLGHTHCGAVEATCEGLKLDKFTQLAAKIKPAVDLIRDQEIGRAHV